MARVVEIFVLVNAVCGITAFVIAKGIAKKVKRRVVGEEETSEQEHGQSP